MGVIAIFAIFAIANANHSRTFQSASEKAFTVTTLWAVPITICLMAGFASILLRRTISHAPWPILQTIFLALAPVLVFTHLGERLTSGRHIGFLAIFILYALAVSSLAACVRNVVVGSAGKQFAKVATNAIAGMGSFVMVLAGNWVFLYFE